MTASFRSPSGCATGQCAAARGPAHMKHVLVALLLVAPAHDAWACSWADPTCTLHAAPVPGQTLPANAPAVVVRSPSGGPGQVALSDMTWTAPDGTVLPTQATAEPYSSLLVKPQAPLVAGVHSLSWKGGCPQSTVQQPVALTVVPAAAVPKQTGLLSADLASGTLTVPAGSLCQTGVSAAWARLHLQLATDAGPWIPLALARVTVDGEIWHEGYYGGIGTDGTLHQWVGATERDPMVVFTKCSGEKWTDSGVAQGKHTIAVQLHIAGMAADPAPATTVVTLQCDLGTDAGGADAVQTDAGSVPGKQVPLSRAPGCDAGGRGAEPVGLMPLVALATCTLRRRRSVQVHWFVADLVP